MRALALSSLVLVAVAGCADDDAGTGPQTSIALPADADAVVLRWSAPVGNGVAPGGTSRLVITAGGDVYEAQVSGPQGLVAGPPMPASSDYVVRRIDADGLQRMMARARELGLLEAPPEYADVGITDQASTEVVLTTSEGELVHRAYALSSPGDESDDARRDLARFVQELSDLEALAGPGLSDGVPFVPASYSVWVETTSSDSGETWDPSVDLSTVDACVELPIADVDPIAGGASELDVVQRGDVHHVRITPVLPVDEACRP